MPTQKLDVLKELFKKNAHDCFTYVTAVDQPPKSFFEIENKELEDYLYVVDVNGLDEESDYREQCEQNYRKPSRWASESGSLSGCYLRFDDESITAHFQNLFKLVAKSTSEICGNLGVGEKIEECNMLARNNLFHAHMMRSEELKDILIIFHAFEYPKDIEDFKADDAKKFESDVPLFNSTKKIFEWRNSIYSRNTNRLYVLNQKGYRDLIISDECQKVVLQQQYCGDKMYDLNYFPRENVGLFLH